MSAVAQPVSPESGAWDRVREGWRLLYGNFDSLGLSIEQHEFRSHEPLDWARSFHRGSLEVCLNVAGRGAVSHGRERSRFTDRTAGFYIPGDRPVTADRAAGETHCFFTIEVSANYLAPRLHAAGEEVHGSAREFLDGKIPAKALGPVQPMTNALEGAVMGMRQPPVAAGAGALWYESKALEILSRVLFKPAEELFCSRQKRVARDRVAIVCMILRERMAEPPTLDELAREAGCSPFYLSRLFSQEMGMTILLYLRKTRMERAAELLLGGAHNVTEAAFEVGYSSLGHFSKAFCEEIGCCPTLFPQAKELVRRFRGRS